MSDLTISLKGIQPPPKACTQAVSESSDEKKAANPQPCYFEFPLVDSKKTFPTTHVVRFDRQGASFVLSNQNTSDSLTWIAKYGDLKELLTISRLLEQIYVGFGDLRSSSEHATITMVAQFVVTGTIRFPESSPFSVDASGVGKISDLANYLLAVFTISQPGGVQKLLGALSLFRRDEGLSEAARERIDWINGVVDLVSKHEAFSKPFVGSLKVKPWSSLESELQEKLRPIFHFSRKAVIHNWLKLPQKWDQDLYKAFQGFQKYHSLLDQVSHVKYFCKALKEANLGLKPNQKLNQSYLDQCHRALNYLPLSPKIALKLSSDQELFSPESIARLQTLVESESRRANMKVAWLRERGRINAMVKILQQHVSVAKTSSKVVPKLRIDSDSMIHGIQLGLSGHLTTRREFLLSALAVLRYYFGSQGTTPQVPVFWNGEFTASTWDLTQKQLDDIRGLTKQIKSELKLSHHSSDFILPLTEGITCAAGTMGTLAMEKWGNPDSTTQRRITLGGYVTAGAGCGAYIGHRLMPKIFKGKVRNRYIWDGASGVSGALLGAGVYFLLHSVINPYQDPTRHPVDEYGP